MYQSRDCEDAPRVSRKGQVIGVGREWKEKEEEDKDDASKDTNKSNTNSHTTRII
jgi:hypothetical protein